VRHCPAAMKRAPWSSCLSLFLFACGSGAGEPTFPLVDGTSVALPLQCRVETVAPAPHRVTFTLRNTGERTVFLAVDYACGITASLSSCARNFEDDLFWHGGNMCPCQGSCPVGGPGCEPAGRPLAPGASETLSWQAIITLQSTRNGEACASGTRALPAGRYRLRANTFASADDATAGTPVLFTISKDFELPAAAQAVDVPFAAP
jgi:hypothetical protein